MTRRSLRHPHQPYRQIVKHWPAPGRLLSVGTHRLHLHCMGQGTPAMVLESGMSGWSQDWAWVQARLAQGGQVCSYDRAGYGWSDPAPAPRDGLAAVDDLRRTLDTAGVATPRLLVGHSMGGLLIGLYARAYPREVAGLAFRRNQHSIAQEAGVQATALPGSGHYLHIDQPDAVAHALDAWREQARHRAASR